MIDGTYRIEASSIDALKKKRCFMPIENTAGNDPSQAVGWIALERVNKELAYMHLDAWYGIFGSRTESEMRLIDGKFYELIMLRVI